MLMKKLTYLMLIATAIITLVSCSNEEFVGKDIQNDPIIPVQNSEQTAINFGSNFKAISRADITGAEAAALLNDRFIVSGYKGKQSEFDTNAGDDQSAIVFDNYQVLWTANTANTTETNVANWEYANIDKYYNSAANAQTVKYWDNNFPQYDFIAYSLGAKEPAAKADDWEGNMPKAGKIAVSAIDPANLKTAAYTLTGSAVDLGGCFIADLVTVKRDVDGYGTKPVTIKFRNLTSKVRVALYETVPGYDVKEVKFYSAADATTPSTNATLYGANDFFCTAGTYTVSYPTLDTPDNKDNSVAHVAYRGNAQAAGELGAFPQTAIGQSSTDATYAGDAAAQYYTAILPQENGGTLNLRVDYTLEATDGLHETIKVYGASAQVPAVYSQWQPGYAYTYIFKISKDTNGYTDPDHQYPEGLYPITFDIVVVNNVAGDGIIQQTITTVTTPSFTTYQAGQSNVDDYVSGKAVYVTVAENDALATLTGKAALYDVPAGKTEAEIADALTMQNNILPEGATTGTIMGRNGIQLPPVDLTLTNQIITTDGVVKTVGTDQAATFTPAAAGSYAFVYTQTPASGNPSEKFEAKTFAPGASVKGYYCNYEYISQDGMNTTAGVVYYTKSEGDVYTVFEGQLPATGNGLYIRADYDPSTFKPCPAGEKAILGKTYYDRYLINNGVYAVKVIKVE